MKDSWLLSTPMLLNANILEMKEKKTQRELFIVIGEMRNILEHLGKNRATKTRQLHPTELTNWKLARRQLSMSLSNEFTVQFQHIPTKEELEC